jgi:hypothetical protein
LQEKFMKIDFAIVNKKILRAYLSFGGTQYFRAFRNEILKASGWTYPEYESVRANSFTNESK